jgi:predicted GH43/DUF377 family glycosyl hydrolase
MNMNTETNMDEIVQRYHGNPILTKQNVPYPVATVHNAGVVKYKNMYIMLFRSHLANGRSIIGLANSEDGFNFTVSPKPFMTPETTGEFAEYERFGIEDMRICPCEGQFLLCYSAYSKHGIRIGLATTKDFIKVQRLAFISQADMRNVVIFPHRINGQYVRLDRPHTESADWSIWVSYSPDLNHWGQSQRVIQPMQYHWDEMKVGPGAPPIKTPQGWLNIYHGVFNTMSGAVYRLGVALHALEDPSRVIAVADDWILQPESPHELIGYVPNVVFTCAAVVEQDETIKLYWGGADSVMCVGTTTIKKLLDHCSNRSRPPL